MNGSRKKINVGGVNSGREVTFSERTIWINKCAVKIRYGNTCRHAVYDK